MIQMPLFYIKLPEVEHFRSEADTILFLQQKKKSALTTIGSVHQHVLVHFS